MIRTRLLALVVFSSLQVHCSQTAAQVQGAASVSEFQDSIPIEVAEALFGFGQGSGMALYDGLTEDFPRFELPDQFEVIGSLNRNPTLSAAMVTPLDEDEARAALTSAFLDQDWVEMPSAEPPMRQYGFVPANEPVRVRHQQLCHDDYGQLSISYRERGERNIVTVSTGMAFGMDFRTCAERIEQQELSRIRSQRFDTGIYEYMPLLRVPEDARQGRQAFLRGGGMSSSGNSAETDTSFFIEWELQDVYQHFAEQLVDLGWTLDAESIGTVTAAGTWTQAAESGSTMIVRLDVVNSAEEQFDLRLRVEGASNRSNSGRGVFYRN